MRSVQWMVCLSLCSLLAACGGSRGGGSGDAGSGDAGDNSSLSVSPESVRLTSEEGELPAPVRVQVTFVGNGVVADYNPGVTPPTWLDVIQAPNTATTADFFISATDRNTVGTRTVNVRFATGQSDGGTARTFELPVTYTITASDLAIAAKQTTLDFSAMQGESAPPQSVTLTFNGQQVELSSLPWWLTFISSSNPNSSPATFGFSNNTINFFPAGTALSGDIVFRTTRPGRSLQRTATVHVNYTVIASNLAITATPAQVDFTAERGGAVPPTQTVTTTFNGTSVDVNGAPSWLTLTRPDNPGSSPAAFGLTVNSTDFPAGTPLSADLVFTTSRSSGNTVTRDFTVHVNYTVVKPPARVLFVAPYLGIANQPGTITARGQNFASAASTVTAVVGTTEIGPLALDSDSQLTINYPALPAGRYPVSIKDLPGTTDAELVVVTPPVLGYKAISAPSTRRHLVWDAERQTLYAVNRGDQQIERYQYAAGAWTTLSPHVLPELTDLDLAPNGRSLIVLSRGAVHDIQLTSSPLVAVARAANPDPFCGGFLDKLAMTNNGNAFIVFNLAQCSGYTASYLYNILDHSIASNQYFSGWLYNGIAAASADGSRIYAGSNGLSPEPSVEIFNSLTNTMTASGINYNLFAVTVSGNASHVILQQLQRLQPLAGPDRESGHIQRSRVGVAGFESGLCLPR